ncbi:MAG: 2,3,4,5-tetrahydropyridine-2,6-dicarboxylate N-succinyltransferase [Bacteroidetes bacterium QS_8_68_28]|nr:MAG: 2,3,4,5-tetrahydropyridine-2,6-dicarboxylate N-succinyltransferase [Bacteroidetes bacterium QS_8_68_28]
MPATDALRQRLDALPPDADGDDAEAAFHDLLDALNDGSARAAERGEDGDWRANAWVKEGILRGFRLGEMADYSTERFPFFDKHTYPLKPLQPGDGVRVVPGGSAVRTGAFLAEGVVCMPPMYVNVGAYVDAETMIDSHALVGSCAQVGRRVHLSAAAQLGGVLEPVGARPVVVEDDVFVGGGCGVYEGCVVREGAVLAAGVRLTGSTRLYDVPNATVHTGTDEDPLEVPARAVVVPGTRSLAGNGSSSNAGDFARAHGLSLYAPVIVKYRDERTDANTALEDALR